MKYPRDPAARALVNQAGASHSLRKFPEMSLHIQSTAAAVRRVKRQRRVSALGGVVLAVVLLTAMGWLLDGMRPEPVPVYRPQFSLQWADIEPTCGGMTACPLPVHSPRNPTPPHSPGVRPLGLAPPNVPVAPVFPTGDLSADILWDDGTWD